MASAAAICGNAAEEAFWEALPSGLARLRTGVSGSLVCAFVTMLVSLLLQLNIVCMSGGRVHSREAEGRAATFFSRYWNQGTRQC